jgi:HK97 family phage major capsid protein
LQGSKNQGDDVMATFGSVGGAFEAYANLPVSTLEARAAAIENDIKNNASADMVSYSYELEAIEQVLGEKRSNGNVKAPEPFTFTASDTKSGEDPKASREYRSAFCKHLQGKELTGEERNAFNAVNVERRDAAFNTLNESMAVVPTVMLESIVTKARDKGGVMSIARGFSMPSGISIPVTTPGSAAAWHVEGAMVDSEEAIPASVTFGANEILKILSISAATKTMSLDTFESYLTEELSASIMQTISTAMLTGTGEGQGLGVLTGITWTTGENQLEYTNELDYHKVLQLIAKLHRGYSQNASFVMNNATLYTQVYNLSDDNDRPLLINDMVESGRGRLMGFNIVIDDYMPDNEIIFGDFNYMGYNLPAGIALDMSQESNFHRGLIDYRGLAIADCRPIVDEAFVRLTQGE